jgi:hypothetical protein
LDDNEGSVLTIPDEAKSEAEVKSEAEAEGEMIYESQPQLVVPTFRLPADDDADALARLQEPRSVAEATARLKSALGEFDALAVQVRGCVLLLLVVEEIDRLMFDAFSHT